MSEATGELTKIQEQKQISRIDFLADGFALKIDELGGIHSIDNCGGLHFTDRNIYIICLAAGIDADNLGQADTRILTSLFRQIDVEAQQRRNDEKVRRSSKSLAAPHLWKYSDHR